MANLTNDDEDLLGLVPYSAPLKPRGRTPETTPAIPPMEQQQQIVTAHIVPLGSSVDDNNLGGAAPGGSATASAERERSDRKVNPERRRRRQSPVQKLANSFKKQSRGSGRSSRRGEEGSSNNNADKTSRRRRGGGGGEKTYQGRMNRKKAPSTHGDQQQQQQAEEYDDRPSPHDLPPEQQQQQSSSSRQQQQQQRPSSSQHGTNASSSAPWAQQAKRVRKKSRDGLTELRRRSRDGANEMRRRLSTTHSSMRRKLSVDADGKVRETGGEMHDVDDEVERGLEQLRREAREREDASKTVEGRKATRRASQEGANNALERLRLEHKARMQQQPPDNGNKQINEGSGGGDGRASKRGSRESIGAGINKRGSRDSTGMSSFYPPVEDDNNKRNNRMPRRLSKSVGHISSDSSFSSADDNIDFLQPQGLVDSDSDSSDSDMLSAAIAKKKKSTKPPPPRGRGLRRASIDCSMRDLQTQALRSDLKKGSTTRHTTTSSAAMTKTQKNNNRRAPATQKRRGSFDQSMLVKDRNWAELLGDSKEKPGTAGAAGAIPIKSKSGYKMSRQRSMSEGPDLSRKSGDGSDLLEKGMRSTHGSMEDFFNMLDKPMPTTTKDKKRHTYSTPVGSSKKDNDTKEKAEGAAAASKRKTYTPGMLDPNKNEEFDSSKNKKSAHAKEMEARLAKTAGKKKRTSVKDGSKDKAGESSKQQRSSQETQVTVATTPGSAENSVNSKSPGGDAEDGSSGKYSQKSKQSSKKSATSKSGGRRRRSPIMMCTMCLCYLLSVLLFAGLGFWVHMKFFAADPDESSSVSSNKNKDVDDGGEEDDGVSSDKEYPTNEPPPPPDMNQNETFTLKAPPPEGPTAYPTFSAIPSYMPSTSFPTSTPSLQPSALPTVSEEPTFSPTSIPSASPSGTPGCPEQLLKSINLDDTLTLKYEVLVYPDGHPYFGDVGGLLCASLEYTGGSAGWIGLGFSEAKRDPSFGRKEAIIGIPGITSSVAMATEGSSQQAQLGQQIVPLENGPQFNNPAKYSIPAGGTGKDGFSGPSIKLMSPNIQQTLMNESVEIVDSFAAAGIISSQGSRMHTHLTFTKFLREAGEIEIKPYDRTLLLYTVAIPEDNNVIDGEYDGNPDWKSTYVTFLEASSAIAKSEGTSPAGGVRMRNRHHNN